MCWDINSWQEMHFCFSVFECIQIRTQNVSNETCFTKTLNVTTFYKKMSIFFFFIDNYESCMQSVCIMLNGEESELRFINNREVPVNYFFIIIICMYDVPAVFVY